MKKKPEYFLRPFCASSNSESMGVRGSVLQDGLTIKLATICKVWSHDDHKVVVFQVIFRTHKVIKNPGGPSIAPNLRGGALTAHELTDRMKLPSLFVDRYGRR